MTDIPAVRKKQKGAALLVVLLLVSTLSVIALSFSEQISLASGRTANIRMRAGALWYAYGTELLALGVLDLVLKEKDLTMSADDSLVMTPLQIPLDGGFMSVVRFSDNTACFNINSLGRVPAGADGMPGASGNGERVLREFLSLATSAGMDRFEAEVLAEVIADWIDADTERRVQGAEDEYYTGLPSPYRTGNTLLASVSETRAMKGAGRDVYMLLRPYLCVHPDTVPSRININMLAERDAPLLAAVLDSYADSRPVTPADALDLIENRPPGGYDSVQQFFDTRGFGELDLGAVPQDRFDVISGYVRIYTQIVHDRPVLDMTTDIMLEKEGARASVISRVIGAEE